MSQHSALPDPLLPPAPPAPFTTAPVPPPAPAGTWRRPARRAARILLYCLLGYGLLWAGAAGGMLALTQWARHDAPSGQRTPAGINHFLRVDAHLYRGSAPTAAGYRELAADGVTTVVDLRAEDLSAPELALPAAAGLTAVRLPVRDGQTPTEQQVDAFLDVVRDAPGPVFVHCGAGVGRTGAMTAAYLVRTGQSTSRRAALRTVAVGPPSIEQVYYALHAGRHASDQPPLVISGISRLLDAPRRIKATL